MLSAVSWLNRLHGKEQLHGLLVEQRRNLPSDRVVVHVAAANGLQVEVELRPGRAAPYKSAEVLSKVLEVCEPRVIERTHGVGVLSDDRSDDDVARQQPEGIEGGVVKDAVALVIEGDVLVGFKAEALIEAVLGKPLVVGVSVVVAEVGGLDEAQLGLKAGADVN